MQEFYFEGAALHMCSDQKVWVKWDTVHAGRHGEQSPHSAICGVRNDRVGDSAEHFSCVNFKCPLSSKTVKLTLTTDVNRSLSEYFAAGFYNIQSRTHTDASSITAVCFPLI